MMIRGNRTQQFLMTGIHIAHKQEGTTTTERGEMALDNRAVKIFSVVTALLSICILLFLLSSSVSLYDFNVKFRC